MNQLWAKIKKIVLPQLAIITGYFLLQKAVLGNWIGQYGADVHLKFDPIIIFANLSKYTTKYSFFSRHLNHPTKEGIYESINDTILTHQTEIQNIHSLLAQKQQHSTAGKV